MLYVSILSFSQFSSLFLGPLGIIVYKLLLYNRVALHFRAYKEEMLSKQLIPSHLKSRTLF